MGQLARWECHKVVKAGKILRPPTLLQDDKGQSLNVYEVTATGDDGAALKIECAADVFSRGFPGVGDYLVIYGDGYKSWSPSRAFEEGYKRQ
jgi:hypothetical protein